MRRDILLKAEVFKIKTTRDLTFVCDKYMYDSLGWHVINMVINQREDS